jgi:flagellar basal-body rod modification protein FlgD
MAIQATNATGNQTAALPTSSNKEVTKEDFLKLLISQLQNQDPLKPLDNQEFAQQLATFNSLEQLISVNQKLGALADKMAQSSEFGATSLLGKQVVSAGNQLSIKQGEGTAVNYNLGANAAKVTIDIKNSNGDIARRLEFLNQSAGDLRAAWDGKNSVGAASPAGSYSFEINALDSTGKKVAASGRIQGIVSGVSLDGAEPMLEIGGVQVPLSGITTVR